MFFVNDKTVSGKSTVFISSCFVRLILLLFNDQIGLEFNSFCLWCLFLSVFVDVLNFIAIKKAFRKV